MPYREGDDARRVYLRLLENLTVARPCRERWSRMQGGERVRHCSRCSKVVRNLSAMSLEELAALVESRKGDPGARFYRRPDGRIVTDACPRPDTARRASLIAGAGVVAVGLAIAAALIASAPDPEPEPDANDLLFSSCECVAMPIVALEIRDRAPDEEDAAGLVANVDHVSHAPADARRASIADLAAVGGLAEAPRLPSYVYDHRCSRFTPAGSFDDAEIEAFDLGLPEFPRSFGWGIYNARRFVPEPCPIEPAPESRAAIDDEIETAID